MGPHPLWTHYDRMLLTGLALGLQSHANVLVEYHECVQCLHRRSRRGLLDGARFYVPQTHYRLYRGRVFTGQMTQPTYKALIGSKDQASIQSGPLPPQHTYNNTTTMQYKTKKNTQRRGMQGVQCTPRAMNTKQIWSLDGLDIILLHALHVNNH